MHKNSALKWILALSIAVVLNLLFNYSLSLIFDEPRYEDSCPNVTEVVYTSSQKCVDDGYNWVMTPEPKRVTVSELESFEPGYCDVYSKCSKDWENVRGEFEKKVFISLIALGIATILISVATKNNIVSLGLGLGAFLDFIIASMRYWRYSEDYTRIIILVIALAVLIWLAVKKFGDR